MKIGILWMLLGSGDKLSNIMCRKCGKEWGPEDYLEHQESLHLVDTGGYGSAFGDGNTWSVILCQDCTLEVLRPYIVWHDEQET